MVDIFKFHHLTGEFLSKREARIDPVSGSPIRLRNSTFSKPPLYGDKEIAVWTGDQWEVQIDLRGQSYWTSDGAEITIAKIGEAIPQDVAHEAPPGPDYILVDGQWVDRPRSIDELWSEIRAARNRALTASDWTQLPDVSLSEEDRAVWTTYRQALRDITNVDVPSDVAWPVPPST
ncbi:tail fiber assembly protein [Celeribacter sp.]|uniref:tail fiber assembly protein n=1 Tax=Celeribacter sp. TaxID=1890673 RepID=UPI003A8D5B89